MENSKTIAVKGKLVRCGDIPVVEGADNSTEEYP